MLGTMIKACLEQKYRIMPAIVLIWDFILH